MGRLAAQLVPALGGALERGELRPALFNREKVWEVQGLGFRVSGLGFRVSGFGFGVKG